MGNPDNSPRRAQAQGHPLPTPRPLCYSPAMATQTLCRDCLTVSDASGRCPACRSPRTLTHPELTALSIAHLDCDAFYAAVEKRDDPTLADKPVIIGGGTRGVVSTACYIARLTGVRSAMPMFKALKLCPDAVVIRPRMQHYVEVSRAIRSLMLELTPAVEPLSLDEAFLDLTGTERLHHAPPVVLLARLQSRIEAELGITASVGLSHNKFLAKIASDLDKPRGLKLIGRSETDAFLSAQPVSIIWGVGQATLTALQREGIRTIADLRTRDRKTLLLRFGSLGDRLYHLSRGEDARTDHPRPHPQDDLARNHLRNRHRRPRHPPLAPLDALRAGLRPRKIPCPGRRHRHPEAQTQRPRPPHPPPDPGQPDSDGRPPLPDRPANAAPRHLLRPLPPDRNRPRRPHPRPWIRDLGRPPHARGRPPPRSRARRRPDSCPLRTRFDHAGPLNPVKAWPEGGATMFFWADVRNLPLTRENLSCGR